VVRHGPANLRHPPAISFRRGTAIHCLRRKLYRSSATLLSRIKANLVKLAKLAKLLPRPPIAHRGRHPRGFTATTVIIVPAPPRFTAIRPDHHAAATFRGKNSGYPRVISVAK